MLWTLILLLVILWALGLLTATAGSLIHLLLVVALIVLIYRLATGHSVE